MTMLLFPDPEVALADLTDKQVEVLDLLMHHHTTKEIARKLKIAPNTVDQRILGVREKWGTRDRKETTRAYAMLLEACGKEPCGFLEVDRPAALDEAFLRDLPKSSLFELADARTFDHWHAPGGKRWGLEALDARFGKFGRVIAIIGLALALAATLLLSLSIAAGIEKLV